MNDLTIEDYITMGLTPVIKRPAKRIAVKTISAFIYPVKVKKPKQNRVRPSHKRAEICPICANAGMVDLIQFGSIICRCQKPYTIPKIQWSFRSLT